MSTNNCGCTDTYVQQTICNQCPTEPCDCPVKDLSTDCSIYKGDDIICRDIVVVKNNTILSQALRDIVAWVCIKFQEVQNYFRIINVGVGSEIYAGNNLIGEKKLRKLNSNSPILTITQNTEDITFSVDDTELSNYVQNNQKTYSVSNVGTGASIYKDSVTTLNNTEFNLKKLKSTNNSVTITEDTNEVNIEVEQTNITEGTNVTITGTGTTLDPYIVNSTDTIALLVDSDTTSITGTGVTGDEYKVNIENLQKTISTFPHTLVSGDDKSTIFINNGASNVTINVPDGLVNKFSCCFIQQGTGEVTIQASGTATLLYPSTLQNKIKSQYFWALVEKDDNTNNYYLVGGLKNV